MSSYQGESRIRYVMEIPRPKIAHNIPCEIADTDQFFILLGGVSVGGHSKRFSHFSLIYLGSLSLQEFRLFR